MKWALLAIALTACTAEPPAVSACESEAERDPTVKELELKGAGSPQFLRDHLEETARAKKDATYRCLQRTGVVRSGAVERQRPL